jgi:hypothetical protein
MIFQEKTDNILARTSEEGLLPYRKSEVRLEGYNHPGPLVSPKNAGCASVELLTLDELAVPLRHGLKSTTAISGLIT